FDLGDDRVWIFFARIIRGDDGVVSKAICHLRHQWALLPVAIAAGAKNGNQAMRLQCPESFENIPERVWRVRVIDENLELSLGWDQFQTPRHLRRLGETKHRVPQVDSQSARRSQ